MRVAFYGRVSTDEQMESGNIEIQSDFARKYFDLHGPESGVSDFEMYLDEGVSGTVPLADRPAGSRLFADVRAKKVQAVYVYRLDRLARSVKHVLDTYEFLEANGVSLKSMTEAFDTGTPTGKFFMTLLASIAALERDTILERTQLGKESKARQGKWVSGPPPFGYRIGQDGCLEIFEPEAETVRLIFNLYAENNSTTEIAKYLNARNIPTPSKSKGLKNESTGKWHAGHISIILRTEAYKGTYNYLRRSKRKKETISIGVPVIIEEKAFTDTQNKLVENADVARGRRGRHYLLRGLIFCGHCGRAMVGNAGSAKEGRVYYRCTGAVDIGQGKQCNAKMVRAQVIENAVWADIQEFIQNPGKIGDLVQKRFSREQKDLEPVRLELAGVEQSITNAQNARGRIIALAARGIITDDEAETELRSLLSEIGALSARREFLFSRMESASRTEREAIDAQSALEILGREIDSGISEDKKAQLFKILVRRVEMFTVEKDGKRDSKASIHYRFPVSNDHCVGLSKLGDVKM